MDIQAAVHIVDNDARTREHLRRSIQAAALVVRVYESAAEFLDDVKPGEAGCVILHLGMSGTCGVEALQALQVTNHNLPVIVIGARVDVATAVRCMKLGASDLLEAPANPLALLDAVRSAIAASMDMQRHNAQCANIRERLEKLTPREQELLKLVVAGRSNKQIAGDLQISIKTVANHRAHLMAKVQAANAAELASMAATAGVHP